MVTGQSELWLTIELTVAVKSGNQWKFEPSVFCAPSPLEGRDLDAPPCLLTDVAVMQLTGGKSGDWAVGKRHRLVRHAGEC
jgi:hypothetical protein